MTASFKLRFLHRSAHYVSKYAHDLNARPSFFFLVFFSSLFTVLILQSLKSAILFQVIFYRRVAAIIVRRLSSTQLSLTTRTNHGKRFVPVGLSQSDLKKQRAGGQSRLQTSRLHKVILLALKPPSLSLCSQLQHHTIMCRWHLRASAHTACTTHQGPDDRVRSTSGATFYTGTDNSKRPPMSYHHDRVERS